MDSLVEPEDEIFRKQYLEAPWGDVGRNITLAVVSGFGKFILTILNSTRIAQNEASRFLHNASSRPPEQGLITVSNHTSTFDDPGLLSVLVPWKFFITDSSHGLVRWSLCAREICYSNSLYSNFFKSGKTLPIDRGKGIKQPVMQVVAKQVAKGSWVHIFPEGRVNYSGKLASPLRWGVGKIFCDAVASGSGPVPIVLPFYHSGMGNVLPRHKWLPRVGQTVTIRVGEPVELSDLVAACKSADESERQCAWREVTRRIEHDLRLLEAQSPPNRAQPLRNKKDWVPSSNREGSLPT